MKPGPRPKPDELRELDGNAGQRRKRNTPKPAPSAGDVPRYLQGNAPAQTLWKELAPGRLKLGLLREGDELLFSALCVEAAIYFRCTRVLARQGLTRESPANGEVKRHELDTRKAALEHVIKIGAAFAMTPGDRARVDVPLGGSAPQAGRSAQPEARSTQPPSPPPGRAPVTSIDDLLQRRARRADARQP